MLFACALYFPCILTSQSPSNTFIDSLSLTSLFFLSFQTQKHKQISLSLSHKTNMSTPSPSSSSSIWILSNIKLQFFTRIKRFLQSKATRKRCDVSEQPHKVEQISTLQVADNHVQDEEMEEVEESEILLQKTVKMLHFGTWEEKEVAAKEIETLVKQDVKLRKLITELGVVPVLVSMVASTVVSRRRAGLSALIYLADGTYT